MPSRRYDDMGSFDRFMTIAEVAPGKDDGGVVKEKDVGNEDLASKPVSIDQMVKIVASTGADTGITYYKTASSTSKQLGKIMAGREYHASQLQNGFYYIDVVSGWVHGSHIQGSDYNKEKAKEKAKDTNAKEKEDAAREEEDANSADNKENEAAGDKKAEDEAKKAEKKKKSEEDAYNDYVEKRLKQFAKTTQEQQSHKYDQYLNSQFGDANMGDTERAVDFLKGNLNAVFALPYQFPSYVDQKIMTSNGSKDSTFGRIYTDRILSRMPLLVISPGKMDFMKNYSDNEREGAWDALWGAGSKDNVNLSDYISHPGRYYDFKYDTDTYWNYLNSMNHACAAYLGIDDVRVNISDKVAKLGNLRWEEAIGDRFKGMILSSKDFIVFYTDADTTKDETFTNETTKSLLAEKVNDYSSLAKEVQFIIGSQAGAPSWLAKAGNTIESVVSEISSIASDLLGGSSLIDNLTREFSTIATGGKLAFPEIWSDSAFTQTLTAKIKLRCPCPNKVQWFLDIIVPLNALIALTLPRTPTGKNALGVEFKDENSSSNGYMTPFLVRAFYKGLFNCDMGIVTSLAISKGKEGSWTIDGLPSEVDVDLEIKDLYNVMYMSSQDTVKEYLNNDCFLNYVASSCGVNINEPDIERSFHLWAITEQNAWRDRLGYTWWQSFTMGLRNRVYDLFTGIFKG